ncbi:MULTISPECIES: hypothetical protein [unclassified Arthrobacter]|uniref:alpha-glutamyl/putrescinyl thymine pyrophosphorylase clade 3 protein n=1 Tax=unclassified Arthrobacter TaxID=235627 RepID=UPI001E385266|nr:MULTISPECIES: hypothetical protein [unclassified Arthrobacter]MCC9146848.1 hypothetical protein [Arthrobacter sp. zg-Y919]MDK1278079.1 hypothetical protein [Arthrobacter sp. zg.Y919]WIB03333.1 hypothetical protein QNO10_01170 [Arthrobacter sp. zg-Y919]
MTSPKSHRPQYQQRFDELMQRIALFEATVAPMPGLAGPLERATFVNQLIDSERRNAYFQHLLKRNIASNAVDPHTSDFDPLRAAISHWNSGAKDEACWLVFLFVHFGKHPVAGWRFSREVYGRLGKFPYWSWDEISSNTPEFRLWLRDNQQELLRTDQRRGFGNHRKYSSLKHDSARGTASVFESYVEWVMPYGDHAALYAAHMSGASPQDGFQSLYDSMEVVVDFGRIAKFDYLMTLSRLEFVDILPGHAYLDKATGPLMGARLLLDGAGSKASAKRLRPVLETFSHVVGVTADVIEDAVCNWQKSPAVFRPFVL